MIPPSHLYDLLISEQIDFFAGVPDSLLKEFLAVLGDPSPHHQISANEGQAIALATGYHLSTDQIPAVYFQNSGLGNALNPLTSLADQNVYGIPLLLLIGWRGEPGRSDEPQHLPCGKITEGLLNLLHIPTKILSDDPETVQTQLSDLLKIARKEKRPVALLIPKGRFETTPKSVGKILPARLSRSEAIRICATAIDEKKNSRLVLATTGMISRELFAVRQQHPSSSRDFYNVGAMGHVSQIALGVALARPQSSIFCFDGDGSVLMHLGGLSTIGASKTKNFYHLVFDNEAHDSVGGQPTTSKTTDLCAVAKACGYWKAQKASTEEEIRTFFQQNLPLEGPVFLLIKVDRGGDEKIPRPPDLKSIKENFRRDFR